MSVGEFHETVSVTVISQALGRSSEYHSFKTVLLDDSVNMPLKFHITDRPADRP